jgi:hypothetical protein
LEQKDVSFYDLVFLSFKQAEESFDFNKQIEKDRELKMRKLQFRLRQLSRS